MNILIVFLLALWIYLIYVLKRAKLHFFKFLIGSVGLFFFMMIFFKAFLVSALCTMVAALSGVIGDATGFFKSFYQYSLILITSGNSTISMYIDYECSGVIEILAFTSLLWFFPVFNTLEKIMYNIVGIIWIFLSNVLRIFVICLIVHFCGDSSFYFAHTIFGRVIFYVLSIVLYFYVFTKSQIKRQKVGNVSYGDDIK